MNPVCKLEELVPTEDRLIVVVDKEDEKSAGGILLPDQAKKRPHKGTIFAAGPGRKYAVTMDPDADAWKGKEAAHSVIPMSSKVGQKILFEQYAGVEIQVLNKENKIIPVRIMREFDVLAVIG